MRTLECDFLVVGSGMAGLSAALYLSLSHAGRLEEALSSKDAFLALHPRN